MVNKFTKWFTAWLICVPLVLGLVMYVGCENTTPTDPPPPVEPPPVDPPPVDPPPVDPPPSETTPRDYKRVDQIDMILENQPARVGLRAKQGWMSNQGARDIDRVLANCPNDIGYLGMTHGQATDFASAGYEFALEATTWINRWDSEGPNRRCNVERDPSSGPGWCDVTNVRKSVWGPWNTSFEAHLDRSGRMRQLAQRCGPFLRSNGGSAYDSIAGWCASMRQAGADSSSCPQ